MPGESRVGSHNILFVISITGLMFGENVYAVLGSTDMTLARAVDDIFRTEGVVPVLQGMLVLSGLGLAIIGVSYGSRH